MENQHKVFGLRGIEISPLQVMQAAGFIMNKVLKIFPEKVCSYIQDVGHTTGCVPADKIQPERSQNCNSNKKDHIMLNLCHEKRIVFLNINHKKV